MSYVIENMNIVFFGSSNFSLPFLEVILSSQHRILSVITQPDRPKGRGLKVSYTSVKDVAVKNNLKVYQPTSINTAEAMEFLERLSPDIFVVVAYGQILSRKILDIPKIFSINVHASLLPRYRGAAPINWALINGEAKTGITIIKMDEGLDTGEVILQTSIDIDEDDDALSLQEKLGREGRPLLIETLEKIAGNKFSLTPQDESKGVSLAPKLKREDGEINWSNSAGSIRNLIRGCIDWPNAFTYYRNKRLKIFKAEVSQSDLKSGLPGVVIGVSKEGILLATGNAGLLIEEVQIEGKRRMGSGEFIAGYKIRMGEVLGNKK